MVPCLLDLKTMKRSLLLVVALLISRTVFAAEQHCVVPGRGYFRIHVGTAGLFGALAHDHSIEAQKVMGCALIDSNDVAHSSVKLEFPTAGIRVIDPKENEKDRAEVQKTMDPAVLHVSAYPRVPFASPGLAP